MDKSSLLVFDWRIFYLLELHFCILRILLKVYDYNCFMASKVKSNSLSSFSQKNIAIYTFNIMILKFVWIQKFMCFRHKHEETRPNSSHEITTFLNYHISLRRYWTHKNVENNTIFTGSIEVVEICTVLKFQGAGVHG